jgi:hypothetical protein
LPNQRSERLQGLRFVHFPQGRQGRGHTELIAEAQSNPFRTVVDSEATHGFA